MIPKRLQRFQILNPMKLQKAYLFFVYIMEHIFLIRVHRMSLHIQIMMLGLINWEKIILEMKRKAIMT